MKVICAIVLLTLHSTQSLSTLGRPNSKFSDKFPALPVDSVEGAQAQATRLGRNQQWRQQERKEARKQKRRGLEEGEERGDLRDTLEDEENVSVTLATPAATPRTEPTKTFDKDDDVTYQKRTFRNENSVKDDYDEFFQVPEIDEPLKDRATVESRRLKKPPKNIDVETKKEFRQRQRQQNSMKKSDGRKKTKSEPLKLQRIEDRKEQRKMSKMNLKKKPFGNKIRNHSLNEKRKSIRKNRRRNSLNPTSTSSTLSKIQSRKENRQQARLSNKMRVKGGKPPKKSQHKKENKDRWHTNKVFSIHQIVKYMLQCQTKQSC